MTSVRFEWDEAKNLSNQRKHDGVSFEEARQVFQDRLHVSVQDRIEGGEQRWQTVGAVQGVVILLVAHTVTEEDADGGGAVGSLATVELFDYVGPSSGGL